MDLQDIIYSLDLILNFLFLSKTWSTMTIPKYDIGDLSMVSWFFISVFYLFQKLDELRLLKWVRKTLSSIKRLPGRRKDMNGETRCVCCGTHCQGYKGPDGKLYCADCYKKSSGNGRGIRIQNKKLFLFRSRWDKVIENNSRSKTVRRIGN